MCTGIRPWLLCGYAFSFISLHPCSVADPVNSVVPQVELWWNCGLSVGPYKELVNVCLSWKKVPETKGMNDSPVWMRNGE